MSNSMNTNIDLGYLANVRPSSRQLAWQRMEMYAFVHFGMNTMTDREWGLGHEDPARFNPSNVDVDQWMSALEAGGMTGVILTCKHHDGFCLWPSKLTAHTIAASPWRNGEGDLVRDVSEAARRHGMKFGVYLSPWDRTEATYGRGKAYDDFYVGQLTELLTRYGPIFSVWLDGANGEGENGKTQYYDWNRYYNVIRSLQPDAVISVCGPDVRWAGNEAGHVRENEWSVVPTRLRSAELTMENSQREDDASFALAVRSQNDDLGSRAAVAKYGDALSWYPAEVDTSIRPGWFYHQYEDDKVKNADQLFKLWLSAVGGNSSLLLNVPPSPEGRFAEPDVQALEGLGRRIKAFRNALSESLFDVSATSSIEHVSHLIDERNDTYWQPSENDAAPAIMLNFPELTEINTIVIEEAIEWGQRIEHLQVAGILPDGTEQPLAQAGTVGYRRILRFRDTEVSAITIYLDGARMRPMISRVAAARIKELS